MILKKHVFISFGTFLFHRSMNGSWHPAMLQRRHPELEKSFDLVENEKYAILGKPCRDL